MHQTNDLLLLSLCLLVAAFVLGAVDGVFFHLQRYRLFAHAESRFEHGIHTVRAWLAVPTLVLLYLLDASGPILLLAAAAVFADQLALLVDLVVEKRSRIHLGGLSHAEYMVHVGANGLHSVAVALAFASRPLDAWTAGYAFPEISALPSPAHWLVAAVLLAAIAGAIQHVMLLCAPGNIEATTRCP